MTDRWTNGQTARGFIAFYRIASPRVKLKGRLRTVSYVGTLACTEMTINNKIRTPQVVLIVGLSWASNDITFGLKKLHLAVRALP